MQKLNFNSKDYDQILFSSDFHYGHKQPFIHQDRGFSTPEEHSVFIEESLLSLTDKDLLFHLGDFALNTPEEKTAELLGKIKCDTYLLMGNHSSGIKQAYQKAKTAFMEQNNFHINADILPLSIAPNVIFMGDHFLVSIDGRKFYCNHFAPMIWDGMQHGWGCLCGHSHRSLQIANPEDKTMRLLDVGVDNALKYNGTTFFSLKDVCEIMDSKNLFVPDHHQNV